MLTLPPCVSGSPMDKGLSLQEGRGAVRLWSDVQQGELIGVTADVALDAVDVRLGADLLPLSLRRVHGRIGAQAVGGEVEISSQDLVFDTQEGEHWPGGVLRVSWEFFATLLPQARCKLIDWTWMP